MEHNQKMRGLSGYIHQIDVVFVLRLWLTELVFIVECKNYGKKVGVDELLEFKSRLDDLRAHKGVFICTSGYQSGTIEFARANRIALTKLTMKEQDVILFDLMAPTLKEEAEHRKNMANALKRRYNDTLYVSQQIEITKNSIIVSRGDCAISLAFLPFSNQPEPGNPRNFDDDLAGSFGDYKAYVTELEMEYGFVAPDQLVRNLVLDELLRT